MGSQNSKIGRRKKIYGGKTIKRIVRKVKDIGFEKRRINLIWKKNVIIRKRETTSAEV